MAIHLYNFPWLKSAKKKVLISINFSTFLEILVRGYAEVIGESTGIALSVCLFYKLDDLNAIKS